MIVRVDTLQPQDKFTFPGETEVYTLVHLSFTRATVTSGRTTTHSFEVTDKTTGEQKTVTINAPVIKDIAPGAEVVRVVDRDTPCG